MSELEALVSTGLIMLVAGYDTTKHALAYLTYQLAMNPDVQDRVYEEISEAMQANGGDLPSYAQLQDLEYTDMVIFETLRMYPPVALLTRSAAGGSQLPGPPEVTIEEGSEVHINLAGIHNDSDTYPQPEVFDPERFSKEAKASRNP